MMGTYHSARWRESPGCEEVKLYTENRTEKLKMIRNVFPGRQYYGVPGVISAFSPR